FAEDAPAWQVLRADATVSRFEALHTTTTPLIGRDEEIDPRRWDQAKHGGAASCWSRGGRASEKHASRKLLWSGTVLNRPQWNSIALTSRSLIGIVPNWCWARQAAQDQGEDQSHTLAPRLNSQFEHL